jgi:hypothetical protein
MSPTYSLEEIEQASQEIARAQAQANSFQDWALIRYCERAIAVARLRLASETVRSLRGPRQ